MYYKIKFTVHGKIGSKKYNFSTIRRKNKVNIYKNKETSVFEEHIEYTAKNYMLRHNLKPLHGGIFIKLVIYIADKKKIKSLPFKPGEFKQVWNTSGENIKNSGWPTPVFTTKKPDCSNVLKSVEDAVTGICFEDDKDIIDVKVKKIACLLDSEERIDIFITDLPNKHVVFQNE